MPLVEIGIRVGGEWRVLAAGRPSDMIAFEDEYGVPGPDPESGKMWRQVSWLAHRIDAPLEPFDQWLASVEDITADPDQLVTIKAELAAKVNGAPTAPPDPPVSPTLEAATGAGG